MPSLLALQMHDRWLGQRSSSGLQIPAHHCSVTNSAAVTIRFGRAQAQVCSTRVRGALEEKRSEGLGQKWTVRAGRS